jgi:acetyl-CoA acetyltransferase
LSELTVHSGRTAFTCRQKMRRALIAGVGMTPFTKPGKTKHDYPQLAALAAKAALADANALPFAAVEAAICGFVYSESCSGKRVCYELGMTGIPVMNVNNNCATGATALRLGYQLVAGGLHDCVLAIGFEKMQPGSLKWGTNPNTESPMQKFFDSVVHAHPEDPPTPSTLANPYMFAMVAREHMAKYGSRKEHFAMIGMKNHAHSANNPYSQFRDVYTLDQVMQSPIAHDPLTRLQCSPTSDGAAAALIVSEAFARDNGLFNRCVEIVGCEMRTDSNDSWDGSSAMNAVGYSMTKKCANQLYAKAKVSPSDVQVIELHDCFSANEMSEVAYARIF